MKKRTTRNKKYLKTRKYKSRNRNRSRKYFGGSIVHVDIRQILISPPIIRAVQRINPDIDVSQFKMSKSTSGFELSRMDRMMASDLNELLEREPVELKKVINSKGIQVGTKIDGEMKPLFEIMNGRHRVAKAIIEQRNIIPAIIAD